MIKDFQKFDLCPGIRCYFCATEKFKTNTVKVFIHTPLEDHTTHTALTPFILKRGCKRWPSTREMVIYLEELYGASFDMDILKLGERQIIASKLEIVNEHYVPNGKELFPKGLSFLFHLLTQPLEEKGGFCREYFHQEKANLRNLIESLINDQIHYSNERLIEEMCRGEPFGLYEYGSKEELQRLRNRDVYCHYRRILSQSPIDIFVIGNLNPESILVELKKNVAFIPRDKRIVPLSPPEKYVRRSARTVIERKEVNQGKLAVGYRVQTPIVKNDYYSLIFFNGILGGGPFSKLFKRVREEANLSYYVASILEKIKGLILVQAGIDSKHFKKALNLIKRQVNDIVRGDITPHEFNSTQRALINKVRAIEDSPSLFINFRLESIVGGMEESLGGALKRVMEVTPEDVVRVGGKVRLSTVYFLTAKGGH